MTKQEFLQRLNRLLADVTREEREEALRYYEEYFDEAGPDEEQAILNELGSPEKVAAIIKANVPGSRIPPRYQAPAAGQDSTGGGEYAAPPRYPVVAAPRTDSRTWMWAIIVGALILLSPLWLSALGTVLGVLAAVAITGAALIFSGALVVIAGIVVMIKGFLAVWTGVGTALLVAGLGVLDLALGFLMLGIGLALFLLLGWLWRMTVRGFNWAKNTLTQNTAGGNAQ